MLEKFIFLLLVPITIGAFGLIHHELDKLKQWTTKNQTNLEGHGMNIGK